MKNNDFFTKYAAHLEAIGNQLAVNFDVPAQRIINFGFATMGVDRFTKSGDDLWEMYNCQKNGWDYEKPPRKLIQRWASY